MSLLYTITVATYRYMYVATVHIYSMYPSFSSTLKHYNYKHVKVAIITYSCYAQIFNYIYMYACDCCWHFKTAVKDLHMCVFLSSNK